MLVSRVTPTSLLKIYVSKLKVFKRCTSNLEPIRNIAILAHIDAGKTTTTERLLYYAGKTKTLGEVHHGNTVTDFLSQERERGITICSSAVTFFWNKHKINLLDTPGHIDFTMEVEQSLFAVDGVFVIMDASAGVEAQTQTVWSQAERFDLPKIIFINKMDRSDADFDACLKNIEDKLDIIPIPILTPFKDKDKLKGLNDVINLKQIIWDQESMGRLYKIKEIEDNLLNQIKDKRRKLIDKLTEIDDNLAESVIVSGSYDEISSDSINQCIRKLTLERKVVPVLLGSAYKNIGIQYLMNAAISYLPSPNERNRLFDCFRDDFVGKVFKIVHDKQKGALTLVRVLRGSLKKGMKIITPNGLSENVQKLYEPLADEYKEITEIIAGNICVCSGLKNTQTGDLLVQSTTSLKKACQNLSPDTSIDEKKPKLDYLMEILNYDSKIPDAVYFCSVEPPNLYQQNALDNALKQLQREDPSLRVKYDETTGQIVLAGMGELHMDIVKARLLTEYKIDVDLGPLQIAYMETINSNAETNFNIAKDIAGLKQSVMLFMSLVKSNKELFSLNKSPDNIDNLNMIRPKSLQMIKKGVLNALERGPRIGGKVINTQIILNTANIGRGTADSFLVSAAYQCVQKGLMEIGTSLLEPIMSLQIITPKDRVSAIISDLARRRSKINDIRYKGERDKIILVDAPLSELSGYSSILRIISSGTANMSMQPSGYSLMNSQDEILAIQRAQGLL